MKKLITIFFLSGLILQGFSYPIQPRPLRKLVMESGYIVVGFVVDIQTRELKETKGKKVISTYEATEAMISIHEVIKGNVTEKVLSVPYSPYMVCPAPPHFIKGTEVIVFLNKVKGDYRIHALSYGVKTLDTLGICIYKDRINEIQEILAIDDKDEQFNKTLEWLVRCAEEPVTRSEGTYELSPGSDFMSYYDRNVTNTYQLMLSPDQKARLKKALLSSPEQSYSDLALVDLVYAGNEKEISEYLYKNLVALDKDNEWFVDEIMRRLSYAIDSDELRLLTKRYDEISFSYEKKDETERKEIIEKFRKKAGEVITAGR